jgi:hypothetical protein
MGVVVVGRGQKTQLAGFQQSDDMKGEWWFDQTGGEGRSGGGGGILIRVWPPQVQL